MKDTIPVLEPLPTGTLKIRVAAAGMGFPDLLQVEGKYQMKAEPPFVPGTQGGTAGEIIAHGPGVDAAEWPLGAQIVGSAVPGPSGHMCGGLADEALVKIDNSIILPAGMTAEMGLTLHENYWDVHHAVVTCGKLSKDDTLLVLGASGACGLAAVDLGRGFGAKVIACASTPAKLDVCKAGGADIVIDYEAGGAEGFLSRLKETGVYGKVTLIYDPVGGSYGETAFRSMAKGGRYVVFGFAAGGTDPKSAFPKFPINLLLMKGQHLIGSMMNEKDIANYRAGGHFAKDMFQMVKDGRLKPLQGSKYSLDNFMQAFDDVANRKVTGKVIITTGVAQSKL